MEPLTKGANFRHKFETMNPQNVELQSLYTSLKITNVKVKRKAEEFLRLLDVRAPGGFKHSTGKSAVCLHLACRLFGESFDKTLAARVCGIDPKSYIQMYTSISNILDVKNCGPSLKELGIKFGCPDAASLAERALAIYKERFLQGLPENRKPHTDFTKPVFTAVAFFLSAEYKKVKIDKSKLLDMTETTSSEFATIKESMEELVFSQLKKQREEERNWMKSTKYDKKSMTASSQSYDSKTDNHSPTSPSSLPDYSNSEQNTTSQSITRESETKEAEDIDVLSEQRFNINSNLIRKFNEEIDLTQLEQSSEGKSFRNNTPKTQEIMTEAENKCAELGPNEAKANELSNISRSERKKRKREEYEKWKAKVLSNKVVVPKKSKQTKLDHFLSTFDILLSRENNI